MTDLKSLFNQEALLRREQERLWILIEETHGMLARKDLSQDSFVSFTNSLFDLCKANAMIEKQLKAIDQHFTHRGTA